MCPRVGEARRGVGVIYHECHDLVVEVGCRHADPVAVPAPAVSTNGVLPERASEVEVFRQHLVDGAVVPLVP